MSAVILLLLNICGLFLNVCTKLSSNAICLLILTVLFYFQYCIKTLQKYGEKSLNDLKLNLALSSEKIS